MAGGYISLVLSESNVNTANNTSVVTAELYYYGNGVSWSNDRQPYRIVIDGTAYSGRSSFSTSTSAQLLGTASKTVTHNDNGAKTVAVSASFATDVSLGTLTTSRNITLTTISRLSSLSVGNGTLGIAQTLTISEPTSSNNHKIKYTCGSEEGYILGSASATSTSNIVRWTPPVSLAAQNTKGTSVAATITLYTFNSNGASVGSKSYSITLAIPASVKPTLTIDVSDPTGYKDTYGNYVQGKSKIKVIPTATIAQGASIVEYEYVIGGTQYKGDTVETSAISQSGSITVKVKATDTRGRYAEVEQTVTVLAYSAPSLEITRVERTNAVGVPKKDGAYLTAYFNASIISLSSLNKATLKVKTKKKTDASWGTETTIVSEVSDYSVTGGEYTFVADTASSYDIMMTLSDSFNVPVQRTATGSSCTKVFSVFSEGKGFAVGKVAEKENTFEVGWDTDLRRALNVDGNLSIGGAVYDSFNTLIGNGLATYTGTGGDAIDPNTTNEHLIVTNKNTPMGGTYLMYIFTAFHETKSGVRAQFAFPYNHIGSMYHRYYADGAWSEWRRHINADELGDYIVEQGTSGIWTYRKWNSGIGEYWGREQSFTLETGWHKSPAAPFTIVNLEKSVATVTNWYGTDNNRGARSNIITVGGLYEDGSISIYDRNYNGTLGTGYRAYYYDVKAYWK